MESSLFNDVHKFSPTAEQATLAAAALGSAAFLWATKGREIQAVVATVEENLLPRLSTKMFSTAVKKDGLAIFKDGETQLTSARASEGVPSFGRSAADQAKHDQADILRSAAYKAQLRDQAISAEATAGRKLLEERGEVMLHPQTGQPLSGTEVYNAKYIDAMPRRSTLEFAEDGTLMPGMYRLNFDQFKASFGQGRQRERLLGNFEQALRGLQRAGVDEVHVGGSFVTKKAVPHDIDFTWDLRAKPVDLAILREHAQGSLLQHDSWMLKDHGMQMMIRPPENGTYKGILHFFAHERVSWPIRSRGMWRTGGMNIPKGLVELDLKTVTQI